MGIYFNRTLILYRLAVTIKLKKSTKAQNDENKKRPTPLFFLCLINLLRCHFKRYLLLINYTNFIFKISPFYFFFIYIFLHEKWLIRNRGNFLFSFCRPLKNAFFRLAKGKGLKTVLHNAYNRIRNHFRVVFFFFIWQGKKAIIFSLKIRFPPLRLTTNYLYWGAGRDAHIYAFWKKGVVSKYCW